MPSFFSPLPAPSRGRKGDRRSIFDSFRPKSSLVMANLVSAESKPANSSSPTPRQVRFSLSPISSRPAKDSERPVSKPYEYLRFQPQPKPATLPASSRPSQKPTRIFLIRDLNIARQVSSRPIINITNPTTSPADPAPASSSARSSHARSPLELVYNIRTKAFRLERRKVLLPNDTGSAMMEMQVDMPPLLVDGRMIIVDVPRWSKSLMLFWRRLDGDGSKVLKREITLPTWVWMQRNLKTGLGRREMFVESG